jgi:hypothetical protein
MNSYTQKFYNFIVIGGSMYKSYNVSVIGKHDVWLKENEADPRSWAVMSKEELEQILKRPIRRKEEVKGRTIIDNNDIVWKKFL